MLDRHHVRTGFRTVACTPEGLFINNRKIKIMGLNRHQSFPYVGYAMGRRAQEKDADILKNYLNANTVRTSHYMQSEYFLDRCDEIGLLVFSEIPGWGHIGGEEFKKVMMQDVESMILTQYNHRVSSSGAYISMSPWMTTNCIPGPTPWPISWIPHGPPQACATSPTAIFWRTCTP